MKSDRQSPFSIPDKLMNGFNIIKRESDIMCLLREEHAIYDGAGLG